MSDFGFSNYGSSNSLGMGDFGSGTGSMLSSVNGGSGYLGNGGAAAGAAGSTDWMSALGSLGSLFGGKDAKGNQSTGLLSGGLGLLQGVGNLYMGMQSYGLAKDQLAAQQQAYKTNLANSVASYNTSLEDKIRGRSSNYDGKEADVQSYLASHKLNT